MITASYALNWTTGLSQPDVDITRAGVATFVGSNGLIQSATADTQRIDWTIGTAAFLVEESRTNQLTYSEDFTQPVWFPIVSSVSSNFDTSPDGTSSADKIILNSGSNTGTTTGVRYTIPVTGVQTLSVFAKADEAKVLKLSFRSASVASDRVAARFDLANKSATNVNGVSASIQEFANGWFRCAVVIDFSTGSVETRIFIGSNDISPGNGVSGIIVWGAQLEAGDFATSYIPTTTTAVTRNADVATITGTNFSDWWQASKGGVLVRARPGTVSGTRPLVQVDDNVHKTLH